MGVFVLGTIGFINILAPMVGYTESTRDYLHIWMREFTTPEADSWKPMLAALAWLQNGHDSGLYQEIFFTQHIKFQYPPTALLPLALLMKLGFSASIRALNGIGWLMVAATAIAMAALSLVLASRSGMPNARHPLIQAAISGLAIFATIAFFPVIFAYANGQIQTWIDLIFVLACLCWVIERPMLSGSLIGAICLLKPQFALFLLWAVIWRHWRFLAGLCGVAGVGLVISIASFGFANHQDYLATLSFLSRHGEAYYPNQSMNGLLNRLLFPELSPSFEFASFPPYNPLVYFGTLISSIVLLSALFLRGRAGNRATFRYFLASAITFTVASPVAWEHHYGILLPALAALLFDLLAAGKNGRHWLEWSLLAISYLLSANFFFLGKIASVAPINGLQSYLWFAGLMLLYLLLRRPASENSGPSPERAAPRPAP